MFQIIWIHYFNDYKNCVIILAIWPLLDEILLFQCRRRRILIHVNVNVSCNQAWTISVDRSEKGVCNLARLNTYARRSRGRQKSNAIYSDPVLCLISSRVRNEKATDLSAPKHAISMQAFQTDSSLSHQSIQPGEKYLHKIGEGEDSKQRKKGSLFLRYAA